MPSSPAKPPYRVPYIRQHREGAGLSLEALAQKVKMDKGNLSKVERGLLPWNQEMLEKLAAALGTEPADLISRDPGAKITPIWDVAPDHVRRQIVEVAEALLRADTGR